VMAMHWELMLQMIGVFGWFTNWAFDSSGIGLWNTLTFYTNKTGFIGLLELALQHQLNLLHLLVGCNYNDL
jgi:hypothetical protein